MKNSKESQSDGVGRLCKEVWITEHVLLINSEAQKGEGGVVDVKHKLLLHPHRIQTVISWEGQEEKTTVIISSTDLHLHKGTDDAAAVFRQMTSSKHLKQEEEKNVRSVLVERVKGVVPHDVRLRNVAAAASEHEQGLVQLHG